MLTNVVFNKRDAKRAAGTIERVPVWFHSIEVAKGVVTPGVKPAEVLADEWQRTALPDLAGRSVLDIGAWDGYFSFASERHGAARVVALDHFSWFVDQAAQRSYWHECKERGETPASWEDVPSVWRPDTLPGKQGFDTARELLGSTVESVVDDFMTMDLARLGQFDVVLFLGVLYHLRDPFEAIRRLRRVTRELAVIETVCTVVPDHEDHAVWEFLEGDELDGDPTNWWVPNAHGLAAMCRAAGFDEVTFTARPGADAPPNPGYDWHYGRAVVHARVTS